LTDTVRLHEEYNFELALETHDTVGMSKGCRQSIPGLRACNRKRSRSNRRWHLWYVETAAIRRLQMSSSWQRWEWHGGVE